MPPAPLNSGVRFNPSDSARMGTLIRSAIHTLSLSLVLVGSFGCSGVATKQALHEPPAPLPTGGPEPCKYVTYHGSYVIVQVLPGASDGTLVYFAFHPEGQTTANNDNADLIGRIYVESPKVGQTFPGMVVKKTDGDCGPGGYYLSINGIPVYITVVPRKPWHDPWHSF
jgi:hypothetical protein